MSGGCDSCALCCKVLAVNEIAKPRSQWCPHCPTRQGCGIYDERPESCRDFTCWWLLAQQRGDQDIFGPDLHPLRCHIVIDCTTDGKGLVLHVDPAYPGAERAPAVQKLIDRTTQRGLLVIIATGEKRRLIRGAKR